MYSNILIPTDGSKLSLKAARQGIRLASATDAGITAFIATPTFRMFTLDPVMSADSPARHATHSRQFAARALKAIEMLAAARGVPCRSRHVVADHPDREIIRMATRCGCELIVMASHGRSGVRGLLLGSIAAKVVSHSSLPVMIIR